MNASHALNAGPDNLHRVGTRPVPPVPRTALLALYAALAAQLAIWSTLVAHIGLTFTQPHHGAQTGVVVGGGVWLVEFTIVVLVATIRYRRHNR
jgi:hypothetical protein